MTWWSSGPHASVEQTRDYLRFNAATGQGHLCWAIAEASADRALGWVTLIDRRPGVAEIGYILNRGHWGGGIAREAVAAVIDFAFARRGLRRVYADTDPDNFGTVAERKSTRLNSRQLCGYRMPYSACKKKQTNKQ